MAEGGENQKPTEAQPQEQTSRYTELNLAALNEMRERDLRRREEKKKRKRTPIGRPDGPTVPFYQADSEEHGDAIKDGIRNKTRKIGPGQSPLIGPNELPPERQIIREEQKREQR